MKFRGLTMMDMFIFGFQIVRKIIKLNKYYGGIMKLWIALHTKYTKLNVQWIKMISHVYLILWGLGLYWTNVRRLPTYDEEDEHRQGVSVHVAVLGHVVCRVLLHPSIRVLRRRVLKTHNYQEEDCCPYLQMFKSYSVFLSCLLTSFD